MNAEVTRYLIAGGLAFLVDFGILYFCTEVLHLHYLLSNVVGYSAGLAVAYLLNTRWVFSFRRYKSTILELLFFNGIVIVGLALSEAIMSLSVEILGLNYLYAKIIASFFVMIFNYVAKKYFLFSPAPSTRAQ